MNTQDDFYRQILDHVNTGVYFVNLERQITFWNHGAELISGYASREVLGQSCKDNLLIHTDEEGNILCKEGCPLQACMLDGKKRSAEVFLKHKGGVRIPVSIYAVPMYDDEGHVTGAVEVFEDLRPVRNLEQTIEELTDEVYLDKLSGAVTRRSIEELLQNRWELYLKGGANMGVIFADMDELKAINDELGHNAGDQAIIHLAETLKNATRQDDVVGRWGGDEFVVMLEVDSYEKLWGVTSKFDALLRSSTAMHKEKEIDVSASYGGALFSEVESLDEMIELADQRMYASKE